MPQPVGPTIGHPTTRNVPKRSPTSMPAVGASMPNRCNTNISPASPTPNEREQAARLFRAMALSERVHEGICADAIVRLGGHYEPPVRVVVFRGTTDGNLNRSIDYERQSLCTRCGKDIHRALSAGNRYAAQILARADAGDMQHVILMERNRNSLSPQDTVRTYAVCPACGNLIVSEHEPDFCPYCLTERGRFVRFY